MRTMPEFDPTVPSIARVYDYLLGGKDNFAADRELAARLLAVAPLTLDVTRENRQFLARAVTWTAKQGTGQFIDLGCGMPTVPNTLGMARAVVPDARVAMIDNDAVVLAHLRALANGDPGVVVVDGDVRDDDSILRAVTACIDLSVPVCLVVGYLLHFFEAEAARSLVARYASALVPGSYVVLSAGRGDGKAADKGFSAYSSGGTRVRNHSVPEFTSFFGSLELVHPGVVDARAWDPDRPEVQRFPPRDGQVIVGVARVP